MFVKPDSLSPESDHGRCIRFLSVSSEGSFLRNKMTAGSECIFSVQVSDLFFIQNGMSIEIVNKKRIFSVCPNLIHGLRNTLTAPKSVIIKDHHSTHR